MSVYSCLFFLGGFEIAARFFKRRLQLIHLATPFPGCLLNRPIARPLGNRVESLRSYDLWTGLRPGLILGKSRDNLRQRTGSRTQFIMPRYTFLDAQDSFADLTAAILHDRRLPIGVRSPQFFD